ncbi:SAM-dependent methyltransferase [Actinoplanes regularis]|uniref:SAM-dependent methyltransferase, MidA family n=1 Tax=Actinoplanes regularis TaxID=52697 RepID=A0A239ANB7_9ACTN|nr:SAM-dependent methyltransferase [Actinoplanes regularis]SNR97049.1 SAM-dependent methyltransferase, MidA family [Actinoplanes regularis]
MGSALYGPDGFFVRPQSGPADHFRTSVHASPLFAGALARLVERVDTALGRPERFDLVDVGAGRGELLTTLCAALPGDLADRVRPVAVEMAARPEGLDGRIRWRRDLPETVTGLLIATEWLDNVPLDVVETDGSGRLRKVLVDRRTGVETLGGPADAAEVLWASRWWAGPGRIEIGAPRDAAWSDAVERVRRGAALCIDYGHRREERPPLGTLTGFRDGRQVPPVPDGSCDVTAHVAVDATAEATGVPYEMIRQREALRPFGISGARPSLALAGSDPVVYLRALAAAGEAAELTSTSGLGAHWWLWHPIGIDLSLA